MWSVSDEDNFAISGTGGALTFDRRCAGLRGAESEYKVTITAVGDRGVDTPADTSDDSTASSTLGVTVKVTNVDEGGSVMMSARQAQVGKSVKASVEDPDGDVSGVTWAWARESDDAVDQTAGCPDCRRSNRRP